VLHVLLPRGLAVLAFDFAVSGEWERESRGKETVALDACLFSSSPSIPHPKKHHARTHTKTKHSQGSGVSEGEYVTLGAHEVDDLASAISALRARRGGARLPVALWGRSMGAATALLAAAADPRIAALVLDSPFASLPDLLADLAAAQRLPLPRALTRAALALMRRSVSRRAGFDVSAVVPAARAGSCFAPALFGHAPGDEFIPIAHTRRLVARYAGDAACVEFGGGHNSVRPPEWYASGLAFLAAVLLENGGGGEGPGAAVVAAATTTRSTTASAAAAHPPPPPPPPRPFAARGGRLPVASASDLAAAAAFFEAGPAAGMGHAYGGPALAAAHAGSEAVGGRGRGGGGRASSSHHHRRAGGHDARDARDELAAALQDGLAVSGRPPTATPPRPARDPGDVWPPGIGGGSGGFGGGGAPWPPSASASPSPARATAGARTPASTTATATPSPVRSHFKVPSPVVRQAAAATTTPGSAQKQLTPQQAELGAFFGKAPTPTPPPRHHHRSSPRAVSPLDGPGGVTATARPASSERAARYAAAAAADAARAARGQARRAWE
jgi:fermentation-respiration switch protein FrsA (DUF1100 family)